MLPRLEEKGFTGALPVVGTVEGAAVAGLLTGAAATGAAAGTDAGAAVVGLVADVAKGFTGATDLRFPPAKGLTGIAPELREGTSAGAEDEGLEGAALTV